MLLHKGGQINNVQLITRVRIVEMSQLQNCSVMCTKNGSYKVRGEGSGGMCTKNGSYCRKKEKNGGGEGWVRGGGGGGGQGGCEQRSEAYVIFFFFFFFFWGGGGGGVGSGWGVRVEVNGEVVVFFFFFFWGGGSGGGSDQGVVWGRG